MEKEFMSTKRTLESAVPPCSADTNLSIVSYGGAGSTVAHDEQLPRSACLRPCYHAPYFCRVYLICSAMRSRKVLPFLTCAVRDGTRGSGRFDAAAVRKARRNARQSSMCAATASPLTVCLAVASQQELQGWRLAGAAPPAGTWPSPGPWRCQALRLASAPLSASAGSAQLRRAQEQACCWAPVDVQAMQPQARAALLTKGGRKRSPAIAARGAARTLMSVPSASFLRSSSLGSSCTASMSASGTCTTQAAALSARCSRFPFNRQPGSAAALGWPA